MIVACGIHCPHTRHNTQFPPPPPPVRPYAALPSGHCTSVSSIGIEQLRDARAEVTQLTATSPTPTHARSSPRRPPVTMSRWRDGHADRSPPIENHLSHPLVVRCLCAHDPRRVPDGREGAVADEPCAPPHRKATRLSAGSCRAGGGEGVWSVISRLRTYTSSCR